MVDSLDADLYPDIISSGGLISALEAVAERKRLDLGRVYSQYAAGPGLFSTAEIDSSRGTASIQLGRQSRAFYVGIQGQGFTWVDGATDDLDVLVEALAAWCDGMPLNSFAERFTFISLGRLAKAHEVGDPTLAQWNWLRTAEEFINERPFVEAVHADGRFRELFPNLSHGTLRLGWSHGLQGAREVRICPLAEGSYRVEDTASSISRVVVTLRDALSLASESLKGN